MNADPVTLVGGALRRPLDPSLLRQFLEVTAAAAFCVPSGGIAARHRGSPPVAFARQVAMYVAHVEVGLSLSDTGRLFGRDRTTAAHACRLVEDRRDDPRLDAALSTITRCVATWLAVPGAAAR